MTREVHWERRERAVKSAMRGLLSNPQVIPYGPLTKNCIEEIVKQAVAIGDALIDELDKSPPCTGCGKPCDGDQFAESAISDNTFCSRACLINYHNHD
jgi:hypothetical protein